VLHAGLTRGEGTLLRELLGSPAARVREFVAPQRLDALVAAAEPARMGEIWRAGALECWLRELESPGFAAGLLAGREADVLDHRLLRTDVDPT
jgi:hypothetical protein